MYGDQQDQQRRGRLQGERHGQRNKRQAGDEEARPYVAEIGGENQRARHQQPAPVAGPQREQSQRSGQKDRA